MAHHYPFSIEWSGNTLLENYSRNAELTSPQKPHLLASSAPEYQGDASRWNPEDLLGSALGLCHMLTFLALAHKSRIEVTHYQDQAKSVLDSLGKGFAITEIHLQPAITVAPGTDTAKARALFEKAHQYCFVANSITSKVVLNPTFLEG
ncbi:MAG: OsmC family protein [Holophagaceae bacterium]